MDKKDFSTKECYDLAVYAKKYVDRANELMTLDRLVIDINDIVIKGTFVIDKEGVPGIGIKSKGKYEHILGGPDLKVTKDNKGKEKKDMTIRLRITKDEIDEYFKSLRFVDYKNFEGLNQAK